MPGASARAHEDVLREPGAGARGDGVREPAPAVLHVARGRREARIEAREVGVERVHHELARVLGEARGQGHREPVSVALLDEADAQPALAGEYVVLAPLVVLAQRAHLGPRQERRELLPVAHAPAEAVARQLEAFRAEALEER